MSEELVEVGDTINVDTGLTRFSFLITRVTKTLALSKLHRDGYDYRFKIAIGSNMTHPHQRWSTAKYEVKRKGKR
tara:strand:+ start:54 stop:278 length:225 start_codon:yes stop_codon:yes gene_type:complete